MIVDEVIQSLALYLDAFALVEGAAELAALTGTPLAMPAAYVWIDNEAGSENERVNGVLQRVEVDVSVLLIVSNVADPRGAAAASDLESLKRAVRDVLVGWEPASADDILTFGEAKIVRIRDGAVWCEMTFVTSYLLGA